MKLVFWMPKSEYLKEEIKYIFEHTPVDFDNIGTTLEYFDEVKAKLEKLWIQYNYGSAEINLLACESASEARRVLLRMKKNILSNKQS